MFGVWYLVGQRRGDVVGAKLPAASCIPWSQLDALLETLGKGDGEAREVERSLQRVMEMTLKQVGLQYHSRTAGRRQWSEADLVGMAGRHRF